jgi:hypothetical protein
MVSNGKMQKNGKHSLVQIQLAAVSSSLITGYETASNIGWYNEG